MPPTNGKLLGYLSVNCAVVMGKPALPGSTVSKESIRMETVCVTDEV
jgi:hypothetical protein